jgi:hypothetical protein
MLTIGRDIVAGTIQQMKIRADLEPQRLDDREKRFSSGGTIDGEMKFVIGPDVAACILLAHRRRHYVDQSLETPDVARA